MSNCFPLLFTSSRDTTIFHIIVLSSHVAIGEENSILKLQKVTCCILNDKAQIAALEAKIQYLEDQYNAEMQERTNAARQGEPPYFRHTASCFMRSTRPLILQLSWKR
uniref:Uncharacterized protein n=1 Tax=Parascaris equorum TaxID=6256 RepID=A0A914RV08_PAREQ